MPMKSSVVLPLLLVVLAACLPSWAADDQISGVFAARDTLRIGEAANEDAAAMIRHLSWVPQEFEVTTRPDPTGQADALITFASPHPSGNAANDTVVIEWYAARGKDGQLIEASAMVVLDIMEGRMRIARLFARSFAFGGVHGFAMHLPYYGPRRPAVIPEDMDHDYALGRVWQAVADARRARDAVAVLPWVRSDRIGIQGTSLGGFVTSLSASLDDAFNPVLMALAGADLYDLLQNAQRDSEKIRIHLETLGYTGQKLRELTWKVEPARLAHRITPGHAWLFSAREDQVVPPDNARALAREIQLDPSHHIWLSGDHYTCAVHLPRLTVDMLRIIKSLPEEASPIPGAGALVGSNASDSVP